jgi:hypothetical protein
LKLLLVTIAISAAVRALAEGKLEIEPLDPKTNTQHIRYAPSFIPGKKPSSPTVGEHPYTLKTLVKALGGNYKASYLAKNHPPAQRRSIPTP